MAAPAGQRARESFHTLCKTPTTPPATDPTGDPPPAVTHTRSRLDLGGAPPQGAAEVIWRSSTPTAARNPSPTAPPMAPQHPLQGPRCSR